MESIGRTIGVVADYTLGTGIVVIHMFLAGRNRSRENVLREDERGVPGSAWRRALRS